MRLIDADRFEQDGAYLRAHLTFPDGTSNQGYAAVLTSVQIKDALTIEATPVVHAHWIETHYVELKGTGLYAIMGTCSNCNCEVITDESAEYCSNCGAVMDEEVPHEMCFDFEKAFHGVLMDEEVE